MICKFMFNLSPKDAEFLKIESLLRNFIYKLDLPLITLELEPIGEMYLFTAYKEIAKDYHFRLKDICSFCLGNIPLNKMPIDRPFAICPYCNRPFNKHVIKIIRKGMKPEFKEEIIKHDN